ncbi:MAG: hypothetical protein KJ697_00250 [Nanoarchaeota archaeon]|nr:hypothetical protein [Nanoarchaeota archaeon]
MKIIIKSQRNSRFLYQLSSICVLIGVFMFTASLSYIQSGLSLGNSSDGTVGILFGFANYFINFGGYVVLLGIFFAFLGFGIDYDENEKRKTLKTNDPVGRFFKWCNR